MSDFTAFIEGTKATLVEQINLQNEAADRVLKADNVNALVHEVRENSDDPTIVKHREWVDRATLEIERRIAEINKYIVDNGMVDTTPVDVDAEREKFKAADTIVKGMLAVLKNIPGGEDLIRELPERKALPGQRGPKAGSGTGVRRPRFAQITVDGADVFDVKEEEKNGVKTERHVANMTVLAAYLSKQSNAKVEVSDLQSAVFEAAKTQDLSTLDGKPVEFVYNVGDKNYQIVATPAVKE